MCITTTHFLACWSFLLAGLAGIRHCRNQMNGKGSDLDRQPQVHNGQKKYRVRRYVRASRTTRARSWFGLATSSLGSTGRCGEGSAETVDDWEMIDLHAVMRFYLILIMNWWLFARKCTGKLTHVSDASFNIAKIAGKQWHIRLRNLGIQLSEASLIQEGDHTIWSDQRFLISQFCRALWNFHRAGSLNWV